MKKTILLSVLFLFCLLHFYACSKSSTENNDTCGSVTRTFSADVNPIVQAYCNQTGCHSSGSINGPGALTNYTQIFNAKAVIRTQIKEGLMPQNATLSASQRNGIICWIDSGAPDN